MITLTQKEFLTDKETSGLKGKYLDESSFDTLVQSDCDCYREDGSILFKFRKSFVTEDEADIGFLAFKKLAKSTHGRGAAGGPIDADSVYWKKRKILKLNKPGGWSANYINVHGDKSNMKIQNEVASNLVGYWSETKSIGMNMPCRLSHYSRREFLKVEDGTAYVQSISNSYKHLHPEWHKKQMEQAQLQPDMTIGDTPFSTVTINRNFRTGVHTDEGDYGFGNLSVLEYGKYHGGFFVLPKYRIAIDMRHADHLCVDVHEFHCNTELFETAEDKAYNDELPDIFKDNLEVGVLGLNNRYARISLVCYLRGALKDCEMDLDPVLMGPELPPSTKLSVFFVNKLKDREKRKKFYPTNWSRCKSHGDAIHRIIKHRMKNTIIIDDTCVLRKNLGNSKQFTERDGITYLNITPENKKKGQRPFSGIVPEALAYYVPDHLTACRLLQQGSEIKTYSINPPLFLP